MEKKHFTMTSSKRQGKLVKNIISRQLYSPFRSSKVKRSLNYTSNPPLLHKFSKFSPMRSRISPHRPFLSDLQPLRSLITPDVSTSDSIQSKYTRFPEDSVNFVQTPSTIREEEPLNDNLIDESLNLYFNFDVSCNPTPLPSINTPDIRYFHRYQNSLPLEFVPPRSETPEIPTRRIENKPEVKLPVVEKKIPRKELQKRNRSPSPQETAKNNKGKLDYFHRNKNFLIFRKK